MHTEQERSFTTIFSSLVADKVQLCNASRLKSCRLGLRKKKTALARPLERRKNFCQPVVIRYSLVVRGPLIVIIIIRVIKKDNRKERVRCCCFRAAETPVGSDSDEEAEQFYFTHLGTAEFDPISGLSRDQPAVTPLFHPPPCQEQ